MAQLEFHIRLRRLLGSLIIVTFIMTTVVQQHFMESNQIQTIFVNKDSHTANKFTPDNRRPSRVALSMKTPHEGPEH